MGIDEIPNLPPQEQEPNEESPKPEPDEDLASLESGDRFRLGPLSDSVRRIASSLSRREQEGLNPLVDERAILFFDLLLQAWRTFPEGRARLRN